MLVPLRSLPDLSAGEFRRPFLGECPDAFCEVFAIAEFELGAPLKIKLRCEVVVESLCKKLACADKSEARASRELCGYLAGVLPEGAVIDGLPDKPPRGGSLGGELVTQQGEAACAGSAEEPGQVP